MKTLPRLTVTLAFVASAVQAQEPTLTLSNGKVFNATMVEAMGDAVGSMVRLDKLSGAVLTCYINITDEGDSGTWNPESLYPCLETDNLAADYLSMKGQVDSQLVEFVSLARTVESTPGADKNDTTAVGGHWGKLGDQLPVGSVSLSDGYELPAAVVELIYLDWHILTLIVEAKDGLLLCLVAALGSYNDERAVQALSECTKPFHESLNVLKANHEEADRQLAELANEMGIK